jgi:hypothetical protein
VYRCYDLAVGARRTVPSPGFEMGRGGRDGEESQEENARSRRARHAFEAMRAVLAAAERVVGRGLIQAVEDVCVSDLLCPPGRLGDLRIALGMIAAHFGFGEQRPPRKQGSWKDSRAVRRRGRSPRCT